GLVDRRDLGVDLSRALDVAGLRRIPHLAHLLADDVRGNGDAAPTAELEYAQKGVVVSSEDRQTLYRRQLLVVGLLDGDDVVDLGQLRQEVRRHVDHY